MSTALQQEGIPLLTGNDGSYWLPYRPNGETCGTCAFNCRLVERYLKEVGVRLLKKERHTADSRLRRIELPENVGLIITSARTARLGVYGDKRSVEISFMTEFSLCDDPWHLHTGWDSIGPAPQRGEEPAFVTPKAILAALGHPFTTTSALLPQRALLKVTDSSVHT